MDAQGTHDTTTVGQSYQAHKITWMQAHSLDQL